MRAYLIVFCLFICGLTFSQNYKLFHAGAKKVFTEYPVPARTYSIAFDTVIQNGPDSVYYNYFQLGDQFTSDTCYFWGSGPICTKQNFPSWIGKKIEYDNSSQYRFFNFSGDTLPFTFNVNTNDSVLFYRDALQKFFYQFIKSDTLNIFNIIDSARYFRIIHTDLNGNSINSSINQQSIIIGKTWGLVRFFQPDSFPQVLKPLNLLGNISPTVGFYQLSNALLYDYQPGDEIQYHEVSVHNPGPPWQNYNYYHKITILTKNLVNDSLIYTALSKRTDQGQTDTIRLIYYPADGGLIQIPFEAFSGNSKTFKLSDYCGLKLWTWKMSPLYLAFCAEDTCWGPYDTNGPPPFSSIQFVAGLGRYYNQYTTMSPDPYYSYSSQIVYFKKNGTSCGTEVIGIKENDETHFNLTICPNPAIDFIRISSDRPMKSISFFNPGGKLIFSKSLTGTSETIDINSLQMGIYFAQLVFIDKTFVMRKLIIVNRER